MGRRRMLPLTLVLVLTFVLGATPALMTAQSLDELGVSFRELEGSREFRFTDQFGSELELQQYDFTFWENASLPERAYPEAMAVMVLSGSFAFRVQDVPVIADPHDPDEPGNGPIPIPILEVTSGGTPVAGPDTYPCEDFCTLPFDTLVALEEGTTVYIPAGAFCIWCNLTAGDGVLRVYASVAQGEEFSWTEVAVNEREQASGTGGVRVYPNSNLPPVAFGCL